MTTDRVWAGFVRPPPPATPEWAAIRATFEGQVGPALELLGAQDPTAFGRYLAERIDPSAPLAVALEGMHVADLALAFALAAGETRALAVFEREYVPYLGGAIARAFKEVDPQELLQELRVAMLVGDAGTPPRILLYRGEGPLRAWLRVTALRSSLHRAKRRHKERPVEDAFFDSMVDGLEPPSHARLEEHKGAVTAALRSAIANLSNRDKGVLKYALVDGISLQKIGVIYGAHRMTVAKWLELARDRVRADVEASLRVQFGASTTELKGVIMEAVAAMDSTVVRMLERR